MVTDVCVFQVAKVPTNWYEYSIPNFCDIITVHKCDNKQRLEKSFQIFLIEQYQFYEIIDFYPTDLDRRPFVRKMFIL